MNREKTILLFNALSTKGLKTKPLSAEIYLKLLGLKKSQTVYLEEMGKDEKTLADSYENLKITEQGYFLDDKGERDAFLAQLKAIQEKDFDPKELNFIPMDQLKPWLDEVDVNVSLVLGEFLLKES